MKSGVLKAEGCRDALVTWDMLLRSAEILTTRSLPAIGGLMVAPRARLRSKDLRYLDTRGEDGLHDGGRGYRNGLSRGVVRRLAARQT
jgi:hypothetical protein